MTELATSGIWLSDVPLDANEGAKGGVLLCIHFRDDLQRFEWLEDDKRIERQVPAGLNDVRVEVVDDLETWGLRPL
jgi:hypothetical protein